MKRLRATSTAHRQSGVVLLIALIMLIVLTMGSLALFRQVGTGIIVASNLAFKNSALIASDRGLEAARAWLTTTSVDLTSASLPDGYYAAWCNTMLDSNNNPDANSDGLIDDCKANPVPGVFDPYTFNWNNSKLAISDDGNGNQVRYVIHRLCRIPGALNFTNSSGTPQECVTLGTASSGGSKEAIDYGNKSLSNKIQPYFRVTTQTTGPRNTVVYSQMIMY